MILGVFGAAQVVMVFIVLILIGGGILLNVFYLLNLQNAMKEVGESRRQVPPANVWLMFIPLFNLIYPFILYPKICDSIKDEYNYRGLSETGDFGRNIGITMPILGLCGIIPFLGYLAAIAHLILFIIFWVKIADYKNVLKRSPKEAGSGSPEGVSIGRSEDLLDG